MLSYLSTTHPVVPLPNREMDTLQERVARDLSGRYALKRELGQGGMAIVFLADDLRHDRKVALKVLRPEISAAIWG